MVKNATAMSVHIGSIIKNYCFSNHINAPDLSKRMGMDTSAIYYIYKSAHLNTKILLKLSEVLNHDFFQYFHTESTQNVHKENTRLNQEIIGLKKECETLRRENEVLNKILERIHPA